MMPNPGIGGLVQPQPGATQQGLPPRTPEEHADLTNRWAGYLKNPSIQAALFQFGASMLANTGNNAPFTARLGTSLGDAGRAAGATAEFQSKAQERADQQRNEQARIGLEGRRVDQAATDAADTKDYRGKALGLDERRLTQDSTNAAADRQLKLQELHSNDNYRKMNLELQQEQLKSSTLGTQTPRERALIAAMKNIEEAAAFDDTYDVDKGVQQAIDIVNRLLPAATAPDGGAPAAVSPAAPATPGAPAAPLAPSSAAPSPDAIPTPPPEAVTQLRANPTPVQKAYFDQIFGQGAADKALGVAAARPVPKLN